MISRYDVVVVGARCAGAATAMLLARAGARVLVVDRGAYATDTLSTHALMRGAVLQLHRWGVLPAIIAAGTPAVRSTTFHYTQNQVTIPIEPRHGVPALFAPRRTLLDRTLVDAATASGASFEFRAQLTDVVQDASGRVNGVIVRTGDGGLRSVGARLVVGADGLHSTVAARVSAKELHRSLHATAVLYAYWSGVTLDGYEWFYAPGVSIGAIPTNDAACVFVTVPSDRFGDIVRGNARAAYHALLARAAPEFYDQLGKGRMVEQLRGFPGHRGFMRESHGPGWALVGDAAYFKDPFTAHGITDALRDAELLARAILEDSATAFLRYQDARDELSRRLFDVTDAIASFEWDDDQLQLLHRSLSEEMARETRALAQLEPMPCLSRLDNGRRAV